MGGLNFNDGNFYPRSPCGERPAELTTLVNKLFISIHALLAESDAFDVLAISAVLISIHALLAESDSDKVPLAESTEISIHALLAESDNADCNCQNVRPDFYPRSPCGERLNGVGLIKHIGGFLSTLSLRRATGGERANQSRYCISIHALLAESDQRT